MWACRSALLVVERSRRLELRPAVSAPGTLRTSRVLPCCGRRVGGSRGTLSLARRTWWIIRCGSRLPGGGLRVHGCGVVVGVGPLNGYCRCSRSLGWWSTALLIIRHCNCVGNKSRQSASGQRVGVLDRAGLEAGRRLGLFERSQAREQSAQRGCVERTCVL